MLVNFWAALHTNGCGFLFKRNLLSCCFKDMFFNQFDPIWTSLCVWYQKSWTHFSKDAQTIKLDLFLFDFEGRFHLLDPPFTQTDKPKCGAQLLFSLGSLTESTMNSMFSGSPKTSVLQGHNGIKVIPFIIISIIMSKTFIYLELILVASTKITGNPWLGMEEHFWTQEIKHKLAVSTRKRQSAVNDPRHNVLGFEQMGFFSHIKLHLKMFTCINDAKCLRH